MNYDFLSASNGSGDTPLMHIQTDRTSGSTTIDVDIVTNVPAKFIGTYGTLLPSGLIDITTKRDFRGHVSGADLIIDAFEPGNTDLGNTAGQVVVVKPTTGWANRVATFIKNATGNGTPEAGTFAALTAAAITAASAALSGALSVGGNATVTGSIEITGVSRVIPGTTATSDGSNNITPSKQNYNVSALASNSTVLAPTWVPGQDMASGQLKIKDNGTIRTLAWNAAWVAIGVTLPTATVANKYMYISYVYNSSDAKWHVVGITRQS